ncbi:U3-containing 90S pre-ribosomal complex subunit-domain containing protein [Globomyces pollinis-pini]|nr:U3-containing 90S pre-ribosomal complex subunit-domain containing protein [Globomyces pollinis-pini]
MSNQKSVESLDEDFVIEKIQVNESEDGESDVGTNEEALEEFVDKDTVETTIQKSPEPKKKKQKKVKPATVGNSKRKQVTFEDLDIDIDPTPELHEKSYSVLLVYENADKPLYVKSHTKIKVLIICSSALRCLEIIKELRQTPRVLVAKLFAKHMKLNEQIQSLKSQPFLVGVGTPSRLIKIIETDPDALKPKRIEHIIIDGQYRDKKSMSILDLPETHIDLKKLVANLKEYAIGVYNF